MGRGVGGELDSDRDSALRRGLGGAVSSGTGEKRRNSRELRELSFGGVRVGGDSDGSGGGGRSRGAEKEKRRGYSVDSVNSGVCLCVSVYICVYVYIMCVNICV